MTKNHAKSIYDWDWNTKFTRVPSHAKRETVNKIAEASSVLELIPCDRVLGAGEWLRRAKLDEKRMREEVDMLLYADLVAPVDDGGVRPSV